MTFRQISAAFFAAAFTLSALAPGLSDDKKEDPKLSQSISQTRSLSRGQVLAKTAAAFRGSPYRFGGRSPKTGFDCSGLVQVVCEKWGVYVPRVASGQYHMGKPVQKSELQAGDLVFFKNTYKRGLSHVGIYLGEGRFVHAATRKKGVIISRLDSGYHLAHYYGARRLDLAKLPVSAPKRSEVLTKEKVYLEDEPSSSAPSEGASDADSH